MTIKLTREEAQQVLDALLLHAAMDELEEEAIELLRARLAQPEPSVEPVAWRIRSIDPMRDWTLMYRCPTPETKFSNIEVQPLYTAPPQREWQSLTDEEKSQVALSCGAMTADWLEFARAIEAKLKEKNT